MKKYYLTYNKEKPLERVQRVITDYCKPDNFKKANVDYVRKFCGALAYSCLFVMPDYKLYHGASYSVAELCLEYPGLVSYNMYDYAGALGAITTSEDITVIKSNLERLLRDCLILEVVQFTKLKPVPVYITLAACYAAIVDDAVLLHNCTSMNYGLVWNYVQEKYLGGLIQ